MAERSMANLSKSQIDQLGERLKKASPSEVDLKLLDEYRKSFATSYEMVVGLIRNNLELQPTGRPAKSTESIIEKLRREKIRLSQIQDIAGCRIIVADITSQEQTIKLLANAFRDCKVMDRRLKPSNGYRAVHVIAKVNNNNVEIQVRTLLQDLWAELSEKLSDIVDVTIKYGGGPAKIQDLLRIESDAVQALEMSEQLQPEPQFRHAQAVVAELRQAFPIALKILLEELDLKRGRKCYF